MPSQPVSTPSDTTMTADTTMIDTPVHTPTPKASQTGSTAFDAPGLAVQPAAGAGSWNTKKFREEYDSVRGRLIDQKFSTANYPDPMTKRPFAPNPEHITPEIEQHFNDLVEKIDLRMAGLRK